MKTSTRFSLKVLVVAICASLGGYAFFSVGTSTGLLKPTPEHALPAPAAAVAAVSYTESLGEGEELTVLAAPRVVQVPAPVEYLFVSASAAVSAVDGATVQLEVVGRGPACEGTSEAGTRRYQTWAEGVSTAAAAQVSANWCIPATPASGVAYRTLDKPWTADSRVLDADFATRYVRFLGRDGRPAAIKAAALATCDEDKGCGYLASISVGDDDRQIAELVTQGNAEIAQARTIADGDETQAADVPDHPPAGVLAFRPVRTQPGR